jgi:tagatose-1,6-bisphosphate aldolase non-catalytic subunit AgaZ/GatZ
VPHHPGSHTVWNTPATVSQHTSNVTLMMRYPDSATVPLPVPQEWTARDYARMLDGQLTAEGYTVLAARLTDGDYAYESVRMPA